MIILLIIIFFIISEYVYYKSFNRHRKNKEEAIDYLIDKGLYDKEIYNEIEYEEVSIKSKDNLNLKGYLIEKHKDSKKYIILIHGYSANHHVHMPFTRMFLNEGYNVLLIDMRSHGESDGKYPSYGYYEKDDIVLWINFLKDRVEDIYLGLHGQSMGGATALMCASICNDVKFVIEDCGFSDLYEELYFRIHDKKLLFPKIILFFMNIIVKARINFNIHHVSPIKDIVSLDIPIMFVHGKEDRDVPYTMAEDMYKSRNNDKDILFLVDDAIHMCSYLKKKKEYERKVHEFLQKLNK